MGAIELRDVTVVHDGRTVLDGVDLRVGDGEGSRCSDVGLRVRRAVVATSTGEVLAVLTRP